MPTGYTHAIENGITFRGARERGVMMSIERATNVDFVLACDRCGDRQVFDKPTGRGLWERMKEKARAAGWGWLLSGYHYCQDCLSEEADRADA